MALTHLFLLVGFTNASSYDGVLGPKLGSIVASSASTASTAALPNQAPLALPTSPWHPKQATSEPLHEPTTTTTEPETDNNLQQQSNIPTDNNNMHNQHQHQHHYHHHLAPLRRRRRRSPLWTIPFVASAASFVSFRRTSRLFHGLVQWMSDNTWVPKTFKELNLQANVVTQVINGPVITSISVLFASLVSMTISSLYQRQADIRLCLTNEIQALRILHTILQPPTVLSSPSSHAYASASPTTMTPEEKHLAQAQDYLHQYIQYFADEINSRGMKRPSVSFPSNGNYNNDNFNHHNDHKNEDDDNDEEEADHPPPPLLALLAWCQQEPVFPAATGAASSSLLYANVSDWVCRLWSDRSHRHLAWSSTFPMVHYITLTFLAVGIGIAFLVATDQSTSIFLDGLPVRILWSILMGSFTALAVICYDLSSPFGGAYQVTTATTTMPWI